MFTTSAIQQCTDVLAQYLPNPEGKITLKTDSKDQACGMKLLILLAFSNCPEVPTEELKRLGDAVKAFDWTDTLGEGTFRIPLPQGELPIVLMMRELQHMQVLMLDALAKAYDYPMTVKENGREEKKLFKCILAADDANGKLLTQMFDGIALSQGAADHAQSIGYIPDLSCKIRGVVQQRPAVMIEKSFAQQLCMKEFGHPVCH